MGRQTEGWTHFSEWRKTESVELQGRVSVPCALFQEGWAVLKVDTPGLTMPWLCMAGAGLRSWRKLGKGHLPRTLRPWQGVKQLDLKEWQGELGSQQRQSPFVSKWHTQQG